MKKKSSGGRSVRLKKSFPRNRVVSNGSKDNTVPLAYGASVNVLALENFGKAKAVFIRCEL